MILTRLFILNKMALYMLFHVGDIMKVNKQKTVNE